MVRHDLLELTPAALTALANAGFVKRAQRDIAAGLLPRLELDADGTVTAHFDDGATTRLPPDRTLRDALCTCPASGLCRHRVMLVLAYQQHQAPLPLVGEGRGEEGEGLGRGPGEGSNVPDNAGTSGQGQEQLPSRTEPAQPWSPAHFDDTTLAATLSPSALEQASKLAASRPVIAVAPWRSEHEPPGARLPMCSVRFFSRTSLAHARCDCKQGTACAHVALAVWAFREAGELPPDAPERMVALTPRHAETEPPTARYLGTEPAQTARTELESLLLALWLDGTAQPLLALSARVEALRAKVQALGWNWIDDAIDELWLLLQAQQSRSTRFDPLRLLAVTAELWARPHAAAHVETTGDPAPLLYPSQILGIGVKGEVALDHLRLVSLGAVLWSDDQAEGADILLADPDTQTVTVLERHWPRPANPAAAAPVPLLNRRIANLPLRQLACGQIVTKTATRRANGHIDIKAGARNTGVMPLSPASWDGLQPPLRQPSVRALTDTLHTRLPDFVLPRQAASGAAAGAGGALHILSGEPLHVTVTWWDAAAQTLHARIHTETPTDPPLHLALPHRTTAPNAVDALTRALTGEWGPLRAIAGSVHLHHGHAQMLPLALMTDERAIVLQIEPPAPEPQPLPTHSTPHTAHSALIQGTQSLLVQWLRQGLRHQGGQMTARIQAQTTALQQAGLTRCAALLNALPSTLRSADRSALLPQLSTLGLLLHGVAKSPTCAIMTSA